MRGVTKAYRADGVAVHALRGVDLHLDPGTYTCIMGPSGSGKTTLLNCLLGLERPDAGEVRIGDADVTRLDEAQLAELRRSRVGVVFQEYNLVSSLTVADNIALPLHLAGRPVPPDRVAGLARAMGVEELLARRPRQLSGGQQQRVAVARALIAEPALVVADEPTGALDSTAAAAVLGLLRRVVDEFGQRVLMVTHDPTAASVADRVLFLADGEWRGELHHASAEEIAAALADLGRRP
jgi:putative ABC transport system ATP-binding protein